MIQTAAPSPATIESSLNRLKLNVTFDARHAIFFVPFTGAAVEYKLLYHTKRDTPHKKEAFSQFRFA